MSWVKDDVSQQQRLKQQEWVADATLKVVVVVVLVMVMAMDELIDELQGCSGLGLWSHAGSGSQKTRLVAVGQQVDKTDAEGIERVWRGRGDWYGSGVRAGTGALS
jgi:hypothetical protein